MPSRSDRSHQVTERLMKEEVPGEQRLRVQTLGAHRFLIGDTQIQASSGTVFQLLLRLVYSPGMSVPRSNLLTELWPELPDERRGANLRQSLYKLRTMGVDVVQLRELVQLSRAQVARTFAVERTVDVFERDVIHGKEPFGPMLPGWRAGSEEMEEWLAGARELVHAEIREVLVVLLRARRERADWSGAQVLARWLLQFDPLHEDATLTVAECAMLSGAKAEAVAILDRYLAELGPEAGDIRLPAAQLRKRFVEPPRSRRKSSLANANQHFVGREAELAELTMAMRRARWHDGSAVLLHGPPGIGKTRMVHELSKIAQIEGYREIVIECRETDQQRPLAGLLEVLPELLDVPGALGCAPESLAVLKRLMGEHDSSPVDDYWPDTKNSGNGLDGHTRRLRARSIRHALVDLISAIADEKPVLLCVEDAHWIDNSSIEVLTDIAARAPSLRLYILATSRLASFSEVNPSRLLANTTVRRLRALSPDESHDLCKAISNEFVSSLPVHIENWVSANCEGNPLALRALIEHWVITGESGGVPPTLTSLLHQRIERLPEAAKRALQVICLLGKHASIENVKSVLEIPNHELLDAIETLERTDCLASQHSALLISHDLIGQTARQRMSRLVESALHAEIGKHLEKRYTETNDLSFFLGALQHHSMSDRPQEMWAFLHQHIDIIEGLQHPNLVLNAVHLAQQASLSKFAAKELSALEARSESMNGAFGRVLEIIPGGTSLPQEISRFKPLEIDEWLSFAESAFRSAPIIDPRHIGAFSVMVTENEQLSFEQRLRAADLGLLIAGNTCDSSLAHACFSGLNLSKSSYFERPETQRTGILYHTVFGSVDIARELALAILERARLEPATSATSIESGRAGYVFRMIGEPVLAQHAFIFSRTVALEVNAPRLAEYPLWQLSQLALEQGDLDTAIKWTKELRILTDSNDDEHANSFAYSHYCLMAVAQGNAKEARQHLEACKRLLPPLTHIRALSFALALEITIELMHPRWIPSIDLLEVALFRFNQTSQFAASDLLAASVGEALLRAEREAESRSLIADYTTHNRRERGPLSARLERLEKRLHGQHL